MKTFLLDIIPKLQQYSQKLDDLTLLTNQHWVVFDEIMHAKYIYIFKSDSELLIANNGRVEKAKWEYLGNNSLLIDRKQESFLFKMVFMDKHVLAMKIDSNDGFALLINENKYNGELNTLESIVDFLTKTYLTSSQSRMLAESKVKQFDTPDINVVIRETFDNQHLEIVSIGDTTIGAKVYINKQQAPDGVYIYKSLTHKLIVQDGEIIQRYYLEKYKNYIIEKADYNMVSVGDKVYSLDWEPIMDGKIRLSLFDYHIIKNGVIIR
jgi:hypothetical protein